MNKNERIETTAIKNALKAFDQEEILEAVKVLSDDILWDELIRRDMEILEKINYIEGIFDISLDNLHTIPASEWADIRTKYNDLRDKVSQIKKEFCE